MRDVIDRVRAWVAWRMLPKRERDELLIVITRLQYTCLWKSNPPVDRDELMLRLEVLKKKISGGNIPK